MGDRRDRRDRRDRPAQPRKGLLSGRYHEQDDTQNDERDDAATPRTRDTPAGAGRRAAPAGGLLARFGPASESGSPEPAEPANHESRRTPPSGGLLSRFGPGSEPAGSVTPPPAEESAPGAQRDMSAWDRQQEQDEPSPAQDDSPSREPRARDWRATDFSTGDLEDWDHRGEIPFEMPPDPDAPQEPSHHMRAAPRYDDDPENDLADDDLGDDDAESPPKRERRSARETWRQSEPEEDRDWQEEAWSESSGEWQSSPATGEQESAWYTAEEPEYRADGGYDDYEEDADYHEDDSREIPYRKRRERVYREGGYAEDEYREDEYRENPYGQRGYAEDDYGEDEYDGRAPDSYSSVEYDAAPRMDESEPLELWEEPQQPEDNQWELVDDLRNALDPNVVAESLNTLAQLSSVSRPMTRIERLRLLAQRRPAAAAMLGLFVLGIMLMCLGLMLFLRA